MYIEEKAKEVGDFIYYEYKKGEFDFFGNKSKDTRICCPNGSEVSLEESITIKLLPCDLSCCHIYLRYEKYTPQKNPNDILMFIKEILDGLHNSKLSIEPCDENSWWTPTPFNQFYIPLEKLNKEILDIILDWRMRLLKTKPA